MDRGLSSSSEQKLAARKEGVHQMGNWAEVHRLSAAEIPFKAWHRAPRAGGMRGNVAVGHLASKLVSVVYLCLLRASPTIPRGTGGTSA